MRPQRFSHAKVLIAMLLASIACTGCTKSLAQAFDACQSAKPRDLVDGVQVVGRSMGWYTGHINSPQGYAGMWMNASPGIRYLLRADMGKDEPLKGVLLRVQDSAAVINRRALLATCNGSMCHTSKVVLRGHLDCERTWEGHYSGVFVPENVERSETK